MADNRITDWKTPVFFVLAVLLCCLVSFLAGRVKGRRVGREIGFREGYDAGLVAPHPADTIWRVDTLRIDRPEVVYETIEKPVYFAVHDTQIVRTTDSVFVALERTRRGYSGEEYAAEVSGVDPVLEWVEVYPKTITITERVVKDAPRWSIGATAGPSVLWDGQLRAGVGLSVGLTYRF